MDVKPVLQKSSEVEDTTTRPPLAPSEKNNAAPPSRKPRPREIASRYKSGISSTSPVSTPSTPRRCTSPNAARTSSAAPTAQLPKRAQSAERRRPSTPSSRPSTPSSASSRPSTPSSPSSRSATLVRDAVTEVHHTSRRLNRAPDGLWPSMRSLSSSFQSDSISSPVSKREREKVTNNSFSDQRKSVDNVGAERKRTPLRGRNSSDQSENSRPLENSHARVIDQHRWPAMLGGKVSGNIMLRSVDLGDKVNRSVSSSVPSRGVSPRRRPVPDGVTDKANKSLSSSIPSRGVSPRRTATSDGVGKGPQQKDLKIPSRGVSPARMPLTDEGSKGLQQSLSEVARRLSIDGTGRAEQMMSSSLNLSSQTTERSTSLTRASKSVSSPIPSVQRPSSPGKALRSTQSPSRTRPSTPVSPSSAVTSRAGAATPSVLSYIIDVRKGKKNADHIDDAHQLRLLHNRDLQWRLVNARADEALLIQQMSTESVLCSVWKTTSRLRDSVVMKRIDVGNLRQRIKLDTIVKEQIAYLERWTALEGEHSNSLSGAIEALKASTVRLPVTGGARADVLSVKNAVSSAVDVMQAMNSSISYLLSKVKCAESLVSELSVFAAKEKTMLDECRELLTTAAALQVQESSLRTHLMQLKQEAL
uniref:AUGMIN subunit 8 n=1 Tax=Ananas comosus var. bracteatus TaxID=296719 RepID=A0A6V7P4Q1_ANACO|nr:unnamed protein product [Ananas comosus var. bracteatus]